MRYLCHPETIPKYLQFCCKILAPKAVFLHGWIRYLYQPQVKHAHTDLFGSHWHKEYCSMQWFHTTDASHIRRIINPPETNATTQRSNKRSLINEPAAPYSRQSSQTRIVPAKRPQLSTWQWQPVAQNELLVLLPMGVQQPLVSTSIPGQEFNGCFTHPLINWFCYLVGGGQATIGFMISKIHCSKKEKLLHRHFCRTTPSRLQQTRGLPEYRGHEKRATVRVSLLNKNSSMELAVI